MTDYDVFNGDADGICALHQYRLANPLDAHLITGVKRDIQLLKQVSPEKAQRVRVFDISFDKNRDAAQALINNGVDLEYFDHHFCGDLPESDTFKAFIDTSAETCTSVIVNQFLEGAHQLWAIVGCFGDGFDVLARRMAADANVPEDLVESYRELGILINYNGYGLSIEDLHFPPADLYQQIKPHQTPESFLSSDSFKTLQIGYASDYSNASGLQAEIVDDVIGVYILPNEKWSARISGVFANELSRNNPERAHALCTDRGDGHYLVSVRAPAVSKEGADELCRQFETGGGRKAAAGINQLPITEFDTFITKFRQQFSR